MEEVTKNSLEVAAVASACIERLKAPDLSRCVVRGDGLGNAKVGQNCSVTLTCVTFRGVIYERPIESLHCSLLSEVEDTRIECMVERTGGGNNEYKISFQPKCEGRHKLHITIDGRHVMGSPFSVTVGKVGNTPQPVVKKKAPRNRRRGTGLGIGTAQMSRRETRNEEYIHVHCVLCGREFYHPYAHQNWYLRYRSSLRATLSDHECIGRLRLAIVCGLFLFVLVILIVPRVVIFLRVS